MSSDLAAALPTRTGGVAAAVAETAPTRSVAVDAAILMAAAAGLAHAISIRTHWDWWRASGVFFVVITAAQFGLAAALFVHRVGTRTLLAGIWSNVLVVSVYVASRLHALPGQPVTTAHHSPRAPGRSWLPAAPEGVGAFDMFALLVELGLVVLLLTLLPAKWRSRTATHLMFTGLAFCVFAAWALNTNGSFR
jgi:hypothetical protein